MTDNLDVTIDLETFYSNKEKYTLTKMTTEEYIRSPNFEAIGVGLGMDGEYTWMEWLEFLSVAKTIPWHRVTARMHHAHFDALILKHHAGILCKAYECTLSMGRALHGTEVGNSLSALSEFYGVGKKGDEVIRADGKRRKDFSKHEWDTYGSYCMQDCRLTDGIFNKMMAAGFPRSELPIIDLTVKMFADPQLVLDRPRAQEFVETEKANKAALMKAAGVDSRGDLLSNEKMAKLLLLAGVDPPMKWSDKKLRMDWAFAKSDPEFAALKDHEDVGDLVRARLGVKSTINETRAERLLNMDSRGKLCIYIRTSGAHTHRWTGAERMNWQNLERVSAALEVRCNGVRLDESQIQEKERGAGVAFHVRGMEVVYDGRNAVAHVEGREYRLRSGAGITVVAGGAQYELKFIERGTLRKSLLAPKGYKIVVADSSQIEARVLAWLCGQQDLVDAFAKNEDVYSQFASIAYGRHVDGKNVKADKPKRLVGKICRLGLGYGMGFVKLSAQMLAGPIGNLPVTFTVADAATMKVDADAFLTNKNKMKRLEEIPSILGMAELTAHAMVCNHLVDTYRKASPKVTEFWYEVCSHLLQCMLDGEEEQCGPIRTKKDALVLPNGLELRYPDLKRHVRTDENGKEKVEWTYWKSHSARAGYRSRMYGGLLTENIDQALARVIVTDQLNALYDGGYIGPGSAWKCVTTTHDEFALCVPEDEAEYASEVLTTVMTVAPEWAAGLPLAAEGGFGTCYGDIK